MGTKPNDWGHPGLNSTPEQRINYSNHIKLIDEETKIDALKVRLVYALKYHSGLEGYSDYRCRQWDPERNKENRTPHFHNINRRCANGTIDVY